MFRGNLDERYVRFELPMDRGWVYVSWLYENDGWLAFAGLTRSGPGYVKQEAKRLMEMVRHARPS